MLIDTHAHLDQLPDLEAALQRARDVGVAGVVAVGTDIEANERTLRIAERWSGYVYPALGVHPCHLAGRDAACVEREVRFVEDNLSAAVAVGEVGLDYHKRTLADVSRELQQDVFRRLLAAASRNGLPVLVHSRYAWTDALRLVTESGARSVVFHWFTGFSSVLHAIMDQGYFVSATPATEYHEEHRRAVKAVAADRLLLETDTPVWYGRDARYESRPADALRSLRAAAALRGESEAAMAESTTRAASQLLGRTVLAAIEEGT